MRWLQRSFSTGCALLKSKGSSSRWIQRQAQDAFSREAKVLNYASRAAFKLISLNKRYNLFKPGMTVVDLGFAPGAWSQVAVEATAPNGRVIGVDILHHPPPKGASAIQGNFLSISVQEHLKKILSDPNLGRRIKSEDEVELEIEEQLEHVEHTELKEESRASSTEQDQQDQASTSDQMVDIVLSDMCAPWLQLGGFQLRTINDPYIRMANTSGLAVRDHANSVDLSDSALLFAIDTLKPGGSFVCKTFMGPDSQALEERIKKVFKTVKRDKPSSSRKESKEMYYVGLKKRPNISRSDVYDYA